MPRVRAAVQPPGSSASASAPDPSSMALKRPQPVKRAASESKLLPPTPPRTTHKRKRRSRSRVTDSSSEDEDPHDVPEPESDQEDGRGSKDGEVHLGYKKRKIMTLDAIAEELSQARAEELFWMGGDTADTSNNASSKKLSYRGVKNRASPITRSRTRSPSSSPPPAAHIFRRGHTGLMSPPPSRRAPTVVPRPATPPPEQAKGKEKDFPKRDSPNNPFLADNSPGPLTASLSSEPRTPKKHVEKPTLTYVFRGVKMLMANPLYTSEEATAEAEARAQLPLAHPDYSPSEAVVPRLLFPEARKHDLARRRAHPTIPRPTSPTPATSRRRSGSSSSDGTRSVDDGAPGPSVLPEPEVDKELMAAAMVERISSRMLKGALADGEAPRTRPSSRSGEPRLPEKDRSDPQKRALGPIRKRF